MSLLPNLAVHPSFFFFPPVPSSTRVRVATLLSDDSGFSNKSEEMRHFFKKRGYPDSAVNTAQHRAQQIDRQSALQTSQKEKNERIPITLTYHPHNLAVKNIILKNFKLLQNDNETGRIFSQPPLILFKLDKNIGNFLVRSVLKSDDQPGTFKFARKRCNTSPFIHNADKITGPKRSIKITDRLVVRELGVSAHFWKFLMNSYN